MATSSGPVTQLPCSWVYTQQKCTQTFIQRHKTRMLIVALLVLDTKGELLQCPSIAHGEVNDSNSYNRLCHSGENEQTVATGHGMCSAHQYRVKNIVQTPKNTHCMIPFYIKFKHSGRNLCC